MFSKDLELTIGQCYKEAREQRHEFMTVEHLLLALLENPSAAAVLRACSADIGKLGRRPALDHHRDRAGAAGRTTSATRSRRSASSACCSARSITCSRRVEKEVTGANVLVAIFGEKDSHAVYFLDQQEVTRLDVVNYISHGIAKIGQESGQQPPARGRTRRRGRRGAARQSADGIRQQPQRARQAGQDRSADRPSRKRSSARSRCCAAGARTIRCTSAKPASARPRSPRVWPSASSRTTCPTC